MKKNTLYPLCIAFSLAILVQMACSLSDNSISDSSATQVPSGEGQFNPNPRPTKEVPQGQPGQENQGGQPGQSGQPGQQGQQGQPAQSGSQSQSPQSPTPGPSGCTNRIALIGSSSISNGQVFEPGEDFEAIWLVQNTGTCPWDSGYSLVLVSGDAFGASSPTSLGSQVAPGDTTNLSLQMTAPTTEDSYLSLWPEKAYYELSHLQHMQFLKQP